MITQQLINYASFYTSTITNLKGSGS
jgi:hypothetical protein